MEIRSSFPFKSKIAYMKQKVILPSTRSQKVILPFDSEAEGNINLNR